ncbi:putative receptor-like protein kinase At4g00960 [Panicum virgatum]|uniref:Cysteine-rich receptor-like protein kinase 10 n=1 Tax=Panicum virgatum TaxID=38727 RepID=A0A8T0PAB0_PANVG|nr:putative receptor-like protein kinase At4g00960 [Panicum virgatum]KAG2559167.1 hypothetical protein PVAP13_8NG310200 [Panicum virgatum]
MTVFVLLLLAAGLTAPSPAAADVFCDNVKAVAGALPRNTSASPVHFATSTVGQAPNVVYALSFCRGDIVNDTACAECVANTFARIFRETPPELECFDAASYFLDCPVFYSGHNIINNSTADDDEPFALWNPNNVTGDVRLIVGLIRQLLLETVQMAANAAPLRFATGAMDSGTTFPVVYSIAQCTPDLSAGDCLACLQRLLGMINATMAPRMGAQIHVIRCCFRYESSPFFDSEPMLRIGPKSLAPAPSHPILPTKHKDATDNFSEENKLGQGGFGAVYKGQLPDGLEIAIKRLASHSGQGFTQFRNEVQLIAKLQHRNLVRLLGCCSQEEEKILVYEYLPNKSLDFFIFDQDKRALLDWSKLHAIIEGIAHGLLYLHKHSRLRVIHRDLKPSNILLDGEMNPKISDFGLAKIFSSNNTQGNTTKRVVGTYGYMAPEYASEGIFSIKSDVFSFGVLVLEILSGKRNSGSHQCGDFINLIGYAWQLWEEGRWADLVDASLVPKTHSVEMMKCINIALLCVQENAIDRPTMVDVVAMLSSETMIPAEPKQPAYFNVRVGNEEASITATDSYSINDVTISVTTPR